MKSENTFSFALPFRWVRRSAVVLLGTLLVLLLHAPLRAGAQGCPSLDTGDFTATLIAANSDCHTPARLTVTYRNAVAGFSAMAYSVSKNRTNYSTPVVTPRPGLPAVLPSTAGTKANRSTFAPWPPAAPDNSPSCCPKSSTM